MNLTPKQALRESWVQLLSRYRWDWFCTFTFREDKHPEAAFKSFKHFDACLNRYLYGRRWLDHPDRTTWVCALERQRRGTIHYHALMAAPGDLNQLARRLDWMDFWHKGMECGFSKIEAINAYNAVCRYVSKYVVKGGELELSPNLLVVDRTQGLLGAARP